jgi:hypothetical protein
MKKLTRMFGAVLCVLLLVTSAFAADTAVTANTAVTPAVTTNSPSLGNAWVMTLGGSGATTTTGESQSSIGVNFSLARTFSRNDSA